MTEKQAPGVDCRLWVDGKVIEFRLGGPLVALPAKTPERKGGRK